MLPLRRLLWIKLSCRIIELFWFTLSGGFSPFLGSLLCFGTLLRVFCLLGWLLGWLLGFLCHVYFFLSGISITRNKPTIPTAKHKSMSVFMLIGVKIISVSNPNRLLECRFDSLPKAQVRRPRSSCKCMVATSYCARRVLAIPNTSRCRSIPCG